MDTLFLKQTLIDYNHDDKLLQYEELQHDANFNVLLSYINEFKHALVDNACDSIQADLFFKKTKRLVEKLNSDYYPCQLKFKNKHDDIYFIIECINTTIEQNENPNIPYFYNYRNISSSINKKMYLFTVV
uniref:Uncharacterized protein n=1 Tax=viral metagenome TaxID=1070528 RepID=A0A6C0CQW9_9ZZZZ